MSGQLYLQDSLPCPCVTPCPFPWGQDLCLSITAPTPSTTLAWLITEGVSGEWTDAGLNGWRVCVQGMGSCPGALVASEGRWGGCNQRRETQTRCSDSTSLVTSPESHVSLATWLNWGPHLFLGHLVTQPNHRYKVSHSFPLGFINDREERGPERSSKQYFWRY